MLMRTVTIRRQPYVMKMAVYKDATTVSSDLYGKSSFENFHTDCSKYALNMPAGSYSITPSTHLNYDRLHYHPCHMYNVAGTDLS